MAFLTSDVSALIFLLCAVLFILGIKGLAHPATATRGNNLAMLGMGLAIVVTLLNEDVTDYWWIAGGMALGALIGIPVAAKIKLTNLPQLVALFNGFVGLAAASVAGATYLQETSLGIAGLGDYIEIALSVLIGTITFTGSIVAGGKLAGKITSTSVKLPLGHITNIALITIALGLFVAFAYTGNLYFLVAIAVCAAVFGITLVLPIGGADMPVVISMLNAYSGWAGVATGFMLENLLLVVGGALVGSSGIILTYIMCKAMNRSFWNVVLGGFGADDDTQEAAPVNAEGKSAKEAGVEDAAFMMNNAQRVIIVPGYGMAVAQAQHAMREVMDILETKGIDIKFAIHPVAGRMPGHMNVLLAEADVPYDNAIEMDVANTQFAQTDVVLIVGANDVVNPDAVKEKSSPLYGMPILEAYKAKMVYVVKRSMRSGYAGVENALFYQDNTSMVFGDAKDVGERLASSLKDF